MDEAERTPASGPSTRGALLAGAGVVLILLAAFFVGAYVAPVVQVHLVVRNAEYRKGYDLSPLGYETRARERLRESLYLPRWVAPDRARTAEILRVCGYPDGEEALVEVLLDPRAPLDARLCIPAVFVAETDGDMDVKSRPWVEGLAKALGDPCGRVRVAAAAGLLRNEVWYITHVPEQSRVGKASAVLVRALRDSDVAVRRDAVGALADIGTFLLYNFDLAYDAGRILEKAVTPALEEALRDEDAAVREAARRALASMPWSRRPVARWGPREVKEQDEQDSAAPSP